MATEISTIDSIDLGTAFGTAAVQVKQRDFIGTVYRYDKIAATVHGNRSEVYDCGAEGSPMRVSSWDVSDQEGVLLPDVASKRARYIERSMSRDSRLQELAQIVGKQLVCSDPNCRHKVRSEEVDSEGKAVWVIDGPAVNNDCWHVTAVYDLQRKFEIFGRALMAKWRKPKVEEVTVAPTLTQELEGSPAPKK